MRPLREHSTVRESSYDLWEKFAHKKANKIGKKRFLKYDSAGQYVPWFESWLGGMFLKALLRRCFQDVDYKPKPYRLCQILARDKIRFIYQLSFVDYLICKALSWYLETRLEAHWHDDLYSFRKGYSQKLCLTRLTEALKGLGSQPAYILKADISQYDHHIDHDILFQKIRDFDLPDTEAVIRLLDGFLKNETFPTEIEGSGSCLIRGLPTGTPLVPVLENLYLLSMDHRLRKLKPLFYARYGDDFIFVDPERTKLLEAEQIITEETKELGLILKPEKVARLAYTKDAKFKDERFEPKRWFEYLGMLIKENCHIGMPARKNKKLRKLLRDQMSFFSAKMPGIIHRPQDRAQFLVDSYSAFIQAQWVKHENLMDLVYLVSDPEERREWDLYIKQLVLKEVFGGFRKKLFRELPASFFHANVFSFKYRADRRWHRKEGAS